MLHFLSSLLFICVVAAWLDVVCQHGPVPDQWRQIGRDLRIRQFHSLQEICIGYPDGFGLHCDPISGQLQTLMPLASLFYGPYNNQGLLNFCGQHCFCTDVTGDIGSRIASNAIAYGIQGQLYDGEAVSVNNQGGDGADQESDVSMSGSSDNDDWDDRPFETYATSCSGTAFGYPHTSDCRAALDQYLDEAPNPRWEDQEFIFAGPNAVPIQEDPQRPRFGVPKTYNSGSCFLRIQPPDDPDFSEPLRRKEVSNPFSHLIRNCVRGQGIGGVAYMTYLNYDEEPPLEVADREFPQSTQLLPICSN